MPVNNGNDNGYINNMYSISKSNTSYCKKDRKCKFIKTRSNYVVNCIISIFGKSFIAMLLYKSIHELAVMFLNMDEIILKNNLKAVNRKDDYFKIRNKSKIIYAIIT